MQSRDASRADEVFGTHTLGLNPRKSVRRGEGSTDLRIGFAGIHVDPGDVIVADEDGIVVLTAEQAGA